MAEDVALAHPGTTPRSSISSATRRWAWHRPGQDQQRHRPALLAGLRGEPIPTVGTTTFRPPYTPVSLGAIGGVQSASIFDPDTAYAAARLACGARRADVRGRPVDAAACLPAARRILSRRLREATNVRRACGLVDVSTLGKIDVQDPTLENSSTGSTATALLPCRSAARYGLMLRDDGIVMDDGTTSRSCRKSLLHDYDDRSGRPGAGASRTPVAGRLARSCASVTSVSDQGAMALAAEQPRSPAKAVSGLEMSAASFTAWRATRNDRRPACHSVSRQLPGELAYEIAAGRRRGGGVGNPARGRCEFDIDVYRREAMAALRIEKGHVAGAELNGQTTPADLASAAWSPQKTFVGSVLLDVPRQRSSRPALSG